MCSLLSKRGYLIFKCLRTIGYLRQFGGLTALLQGLTLISGTQTGCRRLDSYIEQKKFLACGPKFFVEFSAPPEFSGGVTENF